MRIARVLAATALVLGVGIVADPAGAAPASTSRALPAPNRVTTTTHVVATCTPQPPFEPPRTQEYTVRVTVPRHVAPGGQATIGVTVDYPVSAQSTAGSISVRAQQPGDTGIQQFIFVAPGSARLEGTATFPVTAPAGSQIQWTVESWGQGVVFDGHAAGETCRPNTPISVPATRIQRESPLIVAIRHLIGPICARPPVPRLLVPLCRLIA
jgi:hypothetical protein